MLHIFFPIGGDLQIFLQLTNALLQTYHQTAEDRPSPTLIICSSPSSSNMHIMCKVHNANFIIFFTSESCRKCKERRTSSLPGNVVDHKCPCSPAVVGAGDGPEALLSCRVPNLKLDFLSAHLDYPCPELHADCMRAVCHNWTTRKKTDVRSFIHIYIF